MTARSLLTGLLLLGLLVFAAPAAAGSRPSESAIETMLVCPVCHETLDESNAPVAQEMKATIRKRIAEGWTQKQIIDEMVANFGPGVLSTPSKHGFDLLAWVLPIGGVVVGGGAIGWLAWTWSRRRGDGGDGPGSAEPLDPELERRLDDALAHFEG